MKASKQARESLICLSVVSLWAGGSIVPEKASIMRIQHLALLGTGT